MTRQLALRDDIGDDEPMTLAEACEIVFRGTIVDKQRRSWAAARDKAGLSAEITPHVLRHTAATWMMQAGVDIWDAASYLGMSTAMLEDVYGHHHPDFQKEIAGRIGRK